MSKVKFWNITPSDLVIYVGCVVFGYFFGLYLSGL